MVDPDSSAGFVELCLDNRAVNCPHSPKFDRAVLLDPWARDATVHACIHCGTVTFTEKRGDDGRFTGEAWQGFFTMPISDESLAWISQWPRANWIHRYARWPMAAELVRHDVIYLPRDLRCATTKELADVEARLQAEQKNQPGAALRSLARPTTRPPADLPEKLSSYKWMWDALRLTPDTDVRKLAGLAQLHSPASAIAVDLLRERPDFESLLIGALRSDDPTWHSVGVAMARTKTPDPAFTQTLIDLLNEVSLAPNRNVPGRIANCGQCEELLVLIADLKPPGPEIIAALEAFARNVAPHDEYLVKPVEIVIKELQA
jgi:hypothetical protein